MAGALLGKGLREVWTDKAACRARASRGDLRGKTAARSRLDRVAAVQHACRYAVIATAATRQENDGISEMRE
ncbi:hypothetical protein bAD24_III13500 [Burkholderia sp. AD24]|nr:hypothetical protein bAD24_III13500 [Burkholderia sp. AD24]